MRIDKNRLLEASGPGYEDRWLENLPSFPLYFEFLGEPYSDGLYYGLRCREALKRILDCDRHSALWGWSSINGDILDKVTEAAERIISLYPDHREELRGIATGAEVPFNDLLMAMLFPEACLSIGIIPPDRPSGCTFCAYRENGRTIIGNNIDNPPRHTVMRCRRNGVEYFTVFYLGRVWAGGPSMNEYGLTLAFVSIPPFPSWQSDRILWQKSGLSDGTCGYLDLRRILENSKTVDEALSLLDERESLFRSTALLIADASGDLAVASMAPGYHSVLRPAESKTAWPNISFDDTYCQSMLGMTSKEYLQSLEDGDSAKVRSEFLTEAFLNDGGPVDLESMWALMRGNSVICQDMTAITMVMDPVEKQILLGQGNRAENAAYNLCF